MYFVFFKWSRMFLLDAGFAVLLFVWATWLQSNTAADQDFGCRRYICQFFQDIIGNCTCESSGGFCRRIVFLLPEKGSYLKGHVFRNLTVARHTPCEDQCLVESECLSINIGPPVSGKVVCELSNSDHFHDAADLKPRDGWTYRGIENLCSMFKPCLNSAKCLMGFTDKNYHCECAPGYEGEHCEKDTIGHLSSKPGLSCEHIRNLGGSRVDGEYWIDPGKNGNPLKVFCDMTTDGGGWLLVANFIVSASTKYSSPNWASWHTYREISNYASNQMVLSRGALKNLWTLLSFTQMRFHCSKLQGRTFHVITVANSSGEAVVQYFSGQTNDLPYSCGSFKRMDDDNSQLSVTCDQWGYDGSYHVGKWGHRKIKGRLRMYHYAAFVAFSYAWSIVNRSALLCDDGENNIFTINSGDFWRIYVR